MVSGPIHSRDDVRARVLEAARRCFQRNGVSATRMDEIADEAGLKRPNLYRYYANREALIEAVLLSEIELVNARRRKRIRLRGPVGPLLVESLAMGHETALADELTGLLLEADIRETTSAIAQSASVIMGAEADYWYPLIDYGRARGELNPRLTDERIVRWFLTSQVLLAPRPEVVSSLADNLREFFGTFVVPPVLSGSDVPVPGP